MQIAKTTRPRWAIIAAIIAIIFGGVTLFSGGSVLFIDGDARASAGNYVPFVLWFNFVAGFAYILSGVGLFLWQKWGINLALIIFVATLAVFTGFGLHIWLGGSYEPRTIGAMSLRSLVWLVIALKARAAWNNATKRKTVQ